MCCITASALDRADQHSLGEIPLKERIDADNGQGRNHGDRHSDGGRRELLRLRHQPADVAAALRSLRECLGAVQHFPQLQLQDAQIAAGDVEEIVLPCVPLADGTEYGDRRKDRLAEWKDYAEEAAHMRCAVQHGGLLQRRRKRFDVGLNQDHIIARHRTRQDVDQKAVDEMQLLIQNVGRDQARVQVHRDDDRAVEKPSEAELVLRDQISEQCRAEYSQSRAEHCARNGDKGRVEDVRFGKEPCVGRKRKACGQKGNGRFCRQLRVADGVNEDIVERIQTQEGENAQQNVQHGVYHIVADLSFIHARRFLRTLRSDDRFSSGPLGELVDRKEQHHAHDRFEHADGDGKGVLSAAEADLVDVGVQHLDLIRDKRVAEHIILLEARVHNAADGQQEHDDEGVHDTGNGDMHDLRPAPRAVYLRRLVKLRVNAGDGGNVNDRRPADRFPEIQEQLERIHSLAVAQNVDRPLYDSKLQQDRIEKALSAEEHKGQRIDQHPRNEIRKGGHSLYGLFEALAAHLGQRDGKDHGDGRRENIESAEHQRIFQRVHRVLRRGEHGDEILQSDEARLRERLSRLVLKECVDPAKKRPVAEYRHRAEKRDHPKQQRIVEFFLPDLFSGFQAQNVSPHWSCLAR